MTTNSDPGDETPRIVPRRYADAHDGEPKVNMIFFDTYWNKGDTKPKPPAGFHWDEEGQLLMKEKENRKEVLGEGADGGGKRMNAGKNRMDLTPPEWEWALANVTTQGSRKYEARNWELGMPWSTMIGCMKRHINKFQAGERYDGKKFDLEAGTTGCHHLAMVAWNALALMSYDLREIGENDLPKEVQLELFDRVNAETSDLGEKI